MASALLTAAATAAALSIKHYAALSSVHFHDELRVAVVRGLDGVITAYLDEDLPSYASDERIFNRAAKGFRCLPPGGTHMLLTTEDNRAKFIAADLVEEYNFGEAARPPVVVYWRKEKPVSWLSATGGGGARVLRKLSSPTGMVSLRASCLARQSARPRSHAERHDGS